MNLLKDNIKSLFRRYLTASMGSAVVMSVYSFVDTIAIGQSEGPAGAAAMAVINPLFGIFVFFSTLCGIGGAVLMGNARGEGRKEEGDVYFTVSVLAMTLLTAVVWIGLVLFARPVLSLFGADQSLMPMAMRYAKWLIWFCPVFLFPSFLGSFLRNDGAPELAMKAVIIGGLLNIFGDWFLVFPLGMGIEGAAIATVSGTAVQVLIMCSHFFSKSCGLKAVRPFPLPDTVRRIFTVGFGSSVIDLGTVILTCIINNQIMRYGGPAALAVYGVIATIAALFQALFCGIGQALQPIISANYGAGLKTRIQKVLRMGMVTAAVMGILFTGLGAVFPIQITKLFLAATPEVLAAAPSVFRSYFPAFLFMGITVVSTYYLQSVMRSATALTLALLRSVFLSGLLLFILPLFLGLDGVWWAMPVSECVVCVLALFFLTQKKRAENTEN